MLIIGTEIHLLNVLLTKWFLCSPFWNTRQLLLPQHFIFPLHFLLSITTLKSLCLHIDLLQQDILEIKAAVRAQPESTGSSGLQPGNPIHEVPSNPSHPPIYASMWGGKLRAPESEHWSTCIFGNLNMNTGHTELHLNTLPHLHQAWYNHHLTVNWASCAPCARAARQSEGIRYQRIEAEASDSTITRNKREG